MDSAYFREDRRNRFDGYPCGARWHNENGKSAQCKAMYHSMCPKLCSCLCHENERAYQYEEDLRSDTADWRAMQINGI